MNSDELFYYVMEKTREMSVEDRKDFFLMITTAGISVLRASEGQGFLNGYIIGALQDDTGLIPDARQ